ncbi:flavin monoamine oxidase family protein [Rhodococcus erythropolis]|uniref:flavin monoamine oxidase family protein n=1 Tax=Rhodococcus erythropolis TaxID=1833 RepID=UPI001BE891CC|nr:NAD(P)/FAD-dependent oxidoreductase [Rhodococcus erythropolis]MBT2266037.1 FAD-dependent oxidoreductase [Rhodococcus erythropolis]
MSKDIVVIGAGFAGVTAARDLSELGYRVTILEARDRIGGRTHRRKFSDTDADIEVGGGWFAGPIQRHAHREVVRYGLNYKADPPLTTFSHLLGGKRSEAAIPIEADDYLAFERASFHVLNAAQHLNPEIPIDQQPLKSFDVTWEEFLGQVELTPTIVDLFNTHAIDGCGPTHENGSALTVLWNTALFGNSIVNWTTLTDQQLEGGTNALIEAILGGATNVELHLETTVMSVQHDETRAKVTTVDGRVFEADGVVVALPVNVWKTVEFDPPLGHDKIAGAALRPGVHGAKSWALVKNVPAGFFGYGNYKVTNGVSMLIDEGEVDGYRLMMAFSPAGISEENPDGFDPLDIASVQAAIEAFVPGAEVVKVDGHDWNADPYSDGSWSAFKVGELDYLGGMRKPEGRLTFAGSDICRGWISWIDGAIESGTYAAAELDRIVSQA